MSERSDEFDYLTIAEIVTQRVDWKKAIDEALDVVHSIFIFDNLALYVAELGAHDLTEVVYARAVGRGQMAGPDVAWGADIASQVVSTQNTVLQEPQEANLKEDRLKDAYFLGLPLRNSNGIYGALVFVRFGGPAYMPKQILHARYIASQFAGLFERKELNEDILALEEARRMIALQDDFIATISHELRTPLGFIKGYSTTLLRQDTEWDESTRREFLTIIEEEADHLTALLENILESARLESKTLPMRYQQTRLDSMIVEAAARAQARTKNLKIELEFPIRPVAYIDSIRLAQVLDNLFSNAIKYAPGAQIKISIAEVPGYYRIRFADRGPGIPQEHLPDLFKRFFRVPGQGGSGSGLGLFICSKIIEAHRGQMSVQSCLGQGTDFLIDLPIEQTTPA